MSLHKESLQGKYSAALFFLKLQRAAALLAARGILRAVIQHKLLPGTRNCCRSPALLPGCVRTFRTAATGPSNAIGSFPAEAGIRNPRNILEGPGRACELGRVALRWACAGAWRLAQTVQLRIFQLQRQGLPTLTSRNP